MVWHKMKTAAQGRKSKKQHTTPCGDCPWRRKSIPGWTGSVPPNQWILDAHGETRIDCHTLLGQQCAGAAMYRANVAKKPRDRALLILPRNKELVFSNPFEFKEHHEK